jgi:hypothetical protein
LTFLTDLDDLIRYHHGDVKKLREIRNTIRHDNFITTEDKEYVQSLIDTHLTNKSLESSSAGKSGTRIKLETKSKKKDSDSQTNFSFNFSSNKKMGILGGAAAAIAIIVIVGFTTGTQSDSSISSTTNNPLLLTLDQKQYQIADIISISGDAISDRQAITLTIENNDGIKIWKEKIEPKTGGNFSTLLIAGGGGWEDSGSYTITAVQNDLVEKIKFKFIG